MNPLDQMASWDDLTCQRRRVKYKAQNRSNENHDLSDKMLNPKEITDD